MMAKKRLSGLDELMIVNPGNPTTEKEPCLGQVFLGEDDTFYSVKGLIDEEAPKELAEFYLGEDGMIYQLNNLEPSYTPRIGGFERAKNLFGQYFLGEDGTLYKVVTK